MSDYPNSYDNNSKPTPTTDRNAATGISPANTVANLIEIVNILMWKVGLGTEVNFTADAGTDTFTSAGHGLSDNDIVVLTTTGTLPTGLATLTRYYVISSTTNTFQLSATHGGSAVDISSTGSGTHSFTLLLGTGRFLTGNNNGVGAYNKDVPSGDVVGTSDTQTLSNKTLSNPTLNNSAVFNSEYDNGNSGTSDTINWGNGQKQKSTLTGMIVTGKVFCC